MTDLDGISNLCTVNYMNFQITLKSAVVVVVVEKLIGVVIPVNMMTAIYTLQGALSTHAHHAIEDLSTQLHLQPCCIAEVIKPTRAYSALLRA